MISSYNRIFQNHENHISENYYRSIVLAMTDVEVFDKMLATSMKQLIREKPPRPNWLFLQELREDV